MKNLIMFKNLEECIADDSIINMNNVCAIHEDSPLKKITILFNTSYLDRQAALEINSIDNTSQLMFDIFCKKEIIDCDDYRNTGAESVGLDQWKYK